jgi:hypothetical protein
MTYDRKTKKMDKEAYERGRKDLEREYANYRAQRAQADHITYLRGTSEGIRLERKKKNPSTVHKAFVSGSASRGLLSASSHSWYDLHRRTTKRTSQSLCPRVPPESMGCPLPRRMDIKKPRRPARPLSKVPSGERRTCGPNQGSRDSHRLSHRRKPQQAKGDAGAPQ